MTAARPQHAPALVTLAAAGAIAACCAVPNDFTYDDARVIVQNPFTRSWANLPDLFTAAYFQRSGELSYRPVTTLSYFLDYTLWGGGAWGYHATNVALHLAAVLGLYWLLVEAAFGRGPAFLAALLFAVFPANAESVCSAGFREETLLAALGVPAVAAGLRSLRSRHNICWLLAAMLLATASMFAKETGVVAPALALLVGLHIGRAARRARLLALAAALLACVGAYVCVRFGLLVAPGEGGLRAEWSSASLGLMGAFSTLGTYIRLLAWPPSAAVVYGTHDLMGWQAGLALLLFVVALAGVLALCRRGRLHPCSVGLLWCVAALAPASNLVPTGCIVANRLLYLASAGLCIALAGAAKGRRRAWVVALVPAFAATLSLRCLEWRNDAALWRAAVKRNPASLLAKVNSAIAYDLMGRDRYAAKLYERFLEREPQHAKVHFNLAAILHERGDRGRAEREYRQAVASDPRMVAARCNLAQLYRASGRVGAAISLLQQGLRHVGDAGNLHNALGLAYRDKGAMKQALAAFTEAIRIWPHYVPAHYHRGRTLIALGRHAEAKQALLRALELRPDFQPAHQALQGQGDTLTPGSPRSTGRPR